MKPPLTIKVTILGCGSSGGVPRVDGDWGVCDPNNPKNYRTRCSLAVQINDYNVIIDTSPDFRNQVLREGITHVDALLYTHDHADQVHGIDDIRCFTGQGKKIIPAYADAITAGILYNRFDYIFYQKPDCDYPALLNLNTFEAFKPIAITDLKDINIIPFPAPHGKIMAYGFLINKIAYSPDVNFLSDEVLDRLKGLDLWIVDCLRYRKHDTHANLDQVLQWYEHTSPRMMVLTNLHIDMDYNKLSQDLPAGVIPAYDGLSFIFEN